MECFESIFVFIIDGGTEDDINMASINLKKHESGKHKWCLALDETVKILDEAKKRKWVGEWLSKNLKLQRPKHPMSWKMNERSEKSLRTSKVKVLYI